MPATADIVLRTIAVVSAVLLAAVLLKRSRPRAADLPGALFSLAVAAFFVTSTPGVTASLRAAGWPLIALCVTKVAWFWLLARALFRDDARIGPRHLAVVGLVAAAGSWQQIVFLPAYRAGDAGALQVALGFGFDVALSGFIILAVIEAWRGLAADLVEQRRRLRFGFTVLTAAYLGSALVVQTLNLLGEGDALELAMRANPVIVAAVFLGLAGSLVERRRVSWLDVAEPSVRVALSPTEARVLRRLLQAVEHDRVHLTAGLSIGQLARRLDASEPMLRRVINRGLGHRNFNDFLNARRIEVARDALARPELARQPVLAIAMDVGYGSVGAFNRAFKARVGTTPTDYRRKMLRQGRLRP